MYKHLWAEIGKLSKNRRVPDVFCGELWKSTVPPRSKAAAWCSQTLWGLRQDKQLQMCLTFQLPKRAKPAPWALPVHHSSRQWHFPGKCCCAECSLSTCQVVWGQKWSVGFVPAASSSALVRHHIKELCDFYSRALHSSDRAGIVCVETRLFLPFPKLAFRAFDISFNFPSVRKMVPFTSLTLLLGIFTILLVSFISEDVPSALWAVREWDVRCEPPHSLLLKRTNARDLAWLCELVRPSRD